MKKQLVLIFACAALALMACDDDVSSAQKNTDTEEISHMVDTLYLSSKDTVVIKDSVLVKDTVVLKDSIIHKDTIYVIDSLTRGDSSCVVTDQGASFKIQCKDKAPYILNKATCNGKAYDPTIDLCNDSTIFAIEHADTCKGVIYDSRDYFCLASNKVVKKCDGKNYDADSLFCYFDKETETYSTPKRCGGYEYDINKYECEKEIVIGYCGETKYNIFAASGCTNGVLKLSLMPQPEGYTITYACEGIVNPITGKCYHVNHCKRFEWDKCVECNEGFSGEGCNKCSPGYYGENCLKAPLCVHGSLSDGKNGNGSCRCKMGFDGDHCDVCEAGFYGENCENISNCKHGEYDDGVTGSGHCKPGSCEENFDGEDCDHCAEGLFGEKCNKLVTCWHGTAKGDLYGDGHCSECDEGYYGIDCDHISLCAHGIANNGINGDGRCIACYAHFTGIYCDQCAEGYTGENCDTSL